MGGHGSVVFSYLNDPLINDYNHHLLFFGVEEITKEYSSLCKEKNITYSFVHKTSSLYPAYAFEILKILKHHNPSIVVAHSLPTVPILLLHKLFSSTKVILVEHASVQLKRGIDNVWTRLAYMFFHKVIYLTQTALNDAKNKYSSVFRSERSNVISNGIDLIRFAPSYHHKKAKLVLSTHCRLVEVKDLETLLKAFAILSKVLSIELRIAGDGPSKDYLIELTNKLEVSESVSFVGLLGESEIISFLQSTDIYINTSKIESMSTSIMQAMACGLPCIVSNIKGNLQMVTDSINGLVFELSNAESLARKIEELHDNLERRISLGQSARIHAEQKFSNQVMITKYKNLINEML